MEIAMPFIKKGTILESWQTANPITFLESVKLPLLNVDDFIAQKYGDRTGVKAINYNRKQKDVPYFVCCRGAWKMHTDPGYNRFAHHIVLKAVIDSYSPHALMPFNAKDKNVLFLSLAQDLEAINTNFVKSINLYDQLLPLRYS
jgi:hypothetical protein